MMAIEKWRADAQKSAEDFMTLVLPYAKPLLGDVKVIPIEGAIFNGTPDAFDTLAGVDLWAVDEHGIFGVASRVQPCNKPFDTFTIRRSRSSGAPTEYGKRLKAIESGYVYPEWTIQAYVSQDRKQLYSMAAVKTKELILYVMEALEAMKLQHQEIIDVSGHELPFSDVRSNKMAILYNNADGNSFYAVRWKQLAAHGVDLYVRQNKIKQPTKTRDQALVKYVAELQGVKPSLRLRG